MWSLAFVVAISPCFPMNGSSDQRRPQHRGAVRLNADKPGVYITFLRAVEVEPLETGVGRRHLRFRITNNTRSEIWLDMAGVPKEYGDAGLFYTIEGKERGEVRIDSRCHACSVNPLGAARSLEFSIPADHAYGDARLQIDYTFDWERGHESSQGSYSKHSVEYYFSSLPKAVGSKEKLSN